MGTTISILGSMPSTPVKSKNSPVLNTLKATSTEIDSLSWYSTSASASADLQSRHQWTGLCP